MVDRILVAIDGYLNSQIRLFDPDHERGQAALTLNQRYFPHGVGAITNASYAEEYIYVGEILASVAEPEISAAMAQFADLGIMFEQLSSAYAAPAPTSSGPNRPMASVSWPRWSA